MGWDVEELMRNKLEMDDEFEFSCSGCGECCHKEVLLSGYDIFRLAKHQGKMMQEVIQEKCFVYIGSDSKLPIVSIKLRAGDKSCSYLRKGRCEIQEVKPFVCSIYPLGRMYDSRNNEYIYFKQDVGCQSTKKLTLKEWLKSIKIEEIDRMSTLWGKALLDLSLYLQSIKNEEELMKIQHFIFVALYLNYDIKKDYVEQLKVNVVVLEQVLPNFKMGDKK